MVAFGFIDVMVGITEASATRRPSAPRTRRLGSTTARPSDPTRQVPTGWNSSRSGRRRPPSSGASAAAANEGRHRESDQGPCEHGTLLVVAIAVPRRNRLMVTKAPARSGRSSAERIVPLFRPYRLGGRGRRARRAPRPPGIAGRRDRFRDPGELPVPPTAAGSWNPARTATCCARRGCTRRCTRSSSKAAASSGGAPTATSWRTERYAHASRSPRKAECRSPLLWWWA